VIPPGVRDIRRTPAHRRARPGCRSGPPNPCNRRLGPLRIEQTGKGAFQELRVSISFAIPTRLAPGAYDVVYCNAACTTGIGDLIGGTVWVGVARAAPVEPTTTTIAPTTTTSSAPATSTSMLAAEVVVGRAGDQVQSRAWIAVVLAALVAIATLATIAFRKRVRRH
jgi:hypothetical protein